MSTFTNDFLLTLGTLPCETTSILNGILYELHVVYSENQMERNKEQ